jgi:uncharacterized BrkB/YihY/UPF0761 family membrane protein
MRTRLAGTVMLSTVAFFVVAVLVSVGVLWWSGDIARGALIGVICGTAAAFTFGAVITAIGRSGERSGDGHKRSPDGHDR